MGMSPYIRALRAKVGTDLPVLVGVDVKVAPSSVSPGLRPG
jgi:hypothetical protein